MVEGQRGYLPDKELWLAPALLLLFGVIFVGFFWLAGCVHSYWVYPSYPTFKQQIEQALSQYRDSKTMLEFLDKHQVSHSEMHLISVSEKESLSQAATVFRVGIPKARLSEVQYVITASQSVAEWYAWAHCWAVMTFYFDVNGKLVGSDIKEDCRP